MARIVYAKDSRVKGYVALGIGEDGELRRLTVHKIKYSSLGSPSRGEEIDSETVRELEEADEQFRALRRALSFLSYADNSERGLVMKLMRAGFPRRVAEEAVAECVSHGYIRERDQLARLIVTAAEVKLRGPLYIKAYLMQKGYSSSDISEVTDELISSGEVCFPECFRRLCERLGPVGEEERMMLAKKYGYRRSDIG